jgi:hypothetical protein
MRWRIKICYAREVFVFGNDKCEYLYEADEFSGDNFSEQLLSCLHVCVKHRNLGEGLFAFLCAQKFFIYSICVQERIIKTDKH